MDSLDLALTPGEDGIHPMLHRADCPLVRQWAEDGIPVITMLGCARMPNVAQRGLTVHECLKS